MSKADKPLVSVIIPAYNAEEYIEESLLSIINQTYENIEIIVVDDGSIDDTAKILNKYLDQDDRINIIRTRNQGVAKALNVGVLNSKGSYIARMDADDIAVSNRIEIQVKFLNGNLDIGVVGALAEIINEKGVFINKFSSKPEMHKCLVWSMLFSNPFIHPTVMMRSSITNKLLYRETPSEDYDFWVRAFEITKFHNIQQVLLQYRIHSKQATNKLYNNNNNNEMFKVRQNMYQKFGLKNIEYELFLASRIPGTLKFKGVFKYSVFFIKALMAGFTQQDGLTLKEAKCIFKVGAVRFYSDTKHIGDYVFPMYILIVLISLVNLLVFKIKNITKQNRRE